MTQVQCPICHQMVEESELETHGATRHSGVQIMSASESAHIKFGEMVAEARRKERRRR